ncbi:hypothetical protein [Acinetobacter rudis]|uniref:Uncharacterized protein n=1 Tax=Acinetobacter rudis TaxID=632955 RepID=A0AAW8J8H8_9GAMM|nr:hypothetical protein [Acinetobacter rudis]MDQ8935798.1 hypothetical protein [Acinetobacter rudis]MDQ9018001.1 hypothetical protein [Acinetobacter rudis]
MTKSSNSNQKNSSAQQLPTKPERAVKVDAPALKLALDSANPVLASVKTIETKHK